MSGPGPLLGPDDPAPVDVRNGEAVSPFLMICDHAGNAVPAALGSLGLAQAELDRHIGIDIGILGVSVRLSDRLGVPLVFQRYSRLVVECNRRHDAPDLIAPVSDGTPVPGNAGIDAAERERRLAEIVAPYHREIVARLDARAAAGLPTVLVSMHSFTPSLRAQPFQRPWHVGLCYGADDRFSRPVLAALEAEPGLVIGRNEPYGVDMATSYSIPVHGEERGLPYVEFEIRQDLIGEAAGQALWAERLERVLRRAHAAFAGG
ncbi:N-formylglutamate amidohydrolase [Labrys wisconsinensis]|uniref:N-formylglutamate amidohydrolase n=1 Tax=Labrys wisconsinensis TaxID=425677 RepID=A0ABU0IZW1_9HYPH|nr:N-formylglutamate amidohydrolase [Labrys wisconsinensis]MDQ0467557.1 putative N-formylglutamate amidohydrolase [Labrys wisconsinensis]